MSVLPAVLEQERETLCGVRYQHDAGRAASRAGYADGEVVLGGRRVSVKRPRVRSSKGQEIPLPSWEKFAAEDPLNARAVEQMVIGQERGEPAIRRGDDGEAVVVAGRKPGGPLSGRPHD